MVKSCKEVIRVVLLLKLLGQVSGIAVFLSAGLGILTHVFNGWMGINTMTIWSNITTKTSRSQVSLFLSAAALVLTFGAIFTSKGNSNVLVYSKIEPAAAFGDDSPHYVRDTLGYRYPKEYFQFSAQEKRLHNISLMGRHSDTVLSKCQHNHGNHPKFIKRDHKMAGPFKILKRFKNPCWYRGAKDNNARLACLPYFYFIGTPKAGTTDLFWRILEHPHVVRTEVKEQRWFDKYRFIGDEKKYTDYYIQQFDAAAKIIQNATRDTGYHHHIVGDGSPSYMFNNFNWASFPGNEWCLEPRVLALSYIHHLLPSAKLILLVRNPVDRLYSDYLFNANRSSANSTAEEFHQWAWESIQAFQSCCRDHPFRYCLYRHSKVHTFTASIYSRLILDVLKIFPRNQLLVLQMEDYSANLPKRMEGVFDFLGLDPVSEATMKRIVNIRRYNKGKSYRKAGPMFPTTRRMIYRFYKPFNEELADMLDDKKYLWAEE